MAHHQAGPNWTAPWPDEVCGAYPLSSPPGIAEPVPPSSGRGSLIALVASSAVLVVLLAGLAGLYVVRGDEASGAAHAHDGRGPASDGSASDRSASDGPASGRPVSGGAAEYPARIILPTTIAGMPKLEDAALTTTADDTAAKLKSATNADSTVAGYYAPNGDPTHAVGLVGLTTRVANPGVELWSMFNSALKVMNVGDVDAGPLGGVMRCGSAGVGGAAAVTVCGWADGGSLGLGIFRNRSLTDSAELFRRIRNEVLRRG